MKRKIIFGNWKLNNDLTEGVEFAFHTRQFLQENKNIIEGKNLCLGIAPQSPLLHSMLQHFPAEVNIISQNVSEELNGAFTGEVSPNILQSIGITHTLIGHSERRQNFGETNDVIRRKLQTSLEAGMTVVLCCGETLDTRENADYVKFVLEQIKDALREADKPRLKNIIVAYEPIWAIGTGVTATPNDAEEMIAKIRKFFASQYTQAMANEVAILYGGSVKPNNIKEISDKENVDGVLVGGASVKHKSFLELLQAV